MRSHAKASVVVVALFAFFAFAASPAFGVYSKVGVFGNGGPGNGGSGSANGELLDPGQADVSDATGRLYVADTGNDRVQVFKPTATAGEYEAQVAISEPTGLAIDQSDGSVYVATPSGISKFTSTLSPAVGWTDPGVSGPLATDPSSGDLLVADTAGNQVLRFGADGSAAGSFAAERPIDLAANSSGEIFVITSSGDLFAGCGASSTVRRFSAAGVEEGVVGPSMVTPGAIAVDPDGDALIVATHVNEYFCEVPPYYAVLEFFDAAGNPTESLAVANQWAEYSGLAVQGDGSPRAYSVAKDPENDVYGLTTITAFEARFKPEASIDPVVPGSVGATEATFTGTVDPNGIETTYKFEYSVNEGVTWTATASTSAGSGESPVAVQVEAYGLRAAASFLVKLTATNSDGSVSTGPVAFQTPDSVPIVETLPANSISAGSARIAAEVNPGGHATTYHFEYGTTASYGSRVPAGPDASAGSGGDRVGVAQLLQGLQPNTTYHYRIVAQSSLGTSEGDDVSFSTGSTPVACANEAIRVQQGSTFLPDCRAFELVTPPESRAWIEVAGSFALPSGDGVFFGSPDSLPGAIPNGPQPTVDSFAAHRGASGWSSEWTTDAPESEPGTLGSQTAFSNLDGTRSVMNTEYTIDPADTQLHTVDPYLRDANGEKTWLAPGPRTGIETRKAYAATPDLGAVVMTAQKPLLPDDTDDEADVYLWSQGEGLSLQSPDTSGPARITTNSPNGLGAPGVLSVDGSRVFFATSSQLLPEDTDSVDDVYVREDGTTTRLVSVSRRATPAASQTEAGFLAASADGHVACFASNTQLIDADTDSAEDVYCYDLEADTLDRASSGVGDNGPLFARPLALSEDGSTVLFATLAPLTADDADGSLSLFARRDGVTTYVSPLALTDLFNPRRAASTEQGDRAVSMNAAGTTVVFTTEAAALPGDTDSVADVYRWNAGDGLTEISVGPAGGNGPLEAGSGAYDPTFDTLGGSPIRGRVITADDESVFFESDEKLVAADTDGGRLDVYEWRQGEGVRLLSPSGAFDGDAHFIDSSADGRTVFFVTTEAVLPEDVNSSVRDLYAVRVGGGFSSVTPPAGCVGDGCQGPAGAPPALPPPGSAINSGHGNLDERNAKKPRKCPKGKRKVRGNGKVRCVSRHGKRGGKAGKTANKTRGGSNR